MHDEHNPPVANFNRVAHLYQWGEYLTLGALLTHTREHFLPQVCGAKQALVLGDGDGRFLSRLMKAAPTLRALAVDSSAGMLRLLSARCARAGAADRLTTYLRFITSGNLTNGRSVDLVVTHFVLDCLYQNEVDALAKELAEQVEPGCLWLLSDFGLPKTRVARWAARVYIRALYFAFWVLTGLPVRQLPDPQRALYAAGFKRLQRMERLRGLVYTELWQLPSMSKQDR